MRHEGYEFDDDPARVDLKALWAFLSTGAYWGRWRTEDDVRAGVSGSWRVVGCYDAAGNMVGFARAISDGVNLGYLADVYVLPEHRGQKLGRRLVEEMVEHGPGRDFRWLLHTADAHELYRGFGFAAPDDTAMERPSSRPVM